MLIASSLAALGDGRLGACLLVEQGTGMRPSELLKLRKCDVTLPERCWFGRRTDPVVNLGAKVGTMAKRNQAVVLRGDREPRLLDLLRLLVQSTEDSSDCLIGLSLDQMNRQFRNLCEALGI